jgi:deoxyribodipyrimidine photo-lyase
MLEEKRITCLQDRPVNSNGQYVLYWVQSNKRAESNHALNFAIDQANDMNLPLIVYEQLSCNYPYACDRIQQFILENARELAQRFRNRGIRYCFNLERDRKQRLRMLPRLGKDAALLVTDDFPAYIVPSQSRWVAKRLDIPCFAIDSCGIVPLKAFSKQEFAARTIRPKVHRLLPLWFNEPVKTPRLEIDSTGFKLDWDEFRFGEEKLGTVISSCPINHRIRPSPLFAGGYRAGRRMLAEFLSNKLDDYAVKKNKPEIDGTSNLSPYFHFGMLSVQEVALAAQASGRNPASVEAFLEELIVRRELSFNFCRFSSNYESLESLPRWVQKTLSQHASDHRTFTYSLTRFETALTHDDLWNTCQLELIAIGKIHGYLRMYWGKKIIEWSRTVSEALEIMIYLNNQYALDGRDPNSWVGILWCFGLHDRPFGERPIFGQIRFMSRESLKRKIDIPGYIDRIQALI